MYQVHKRIINERDMSVQKIVFSMYHFYQRYVEIFSNCKRIGNMKQEALMCTAYVFPKEKLRNLFLKKLCKCIANGSTIHFCVTELSIKTQSGEAKPDLLVRSSS
jgi:hypothetical protein